MAAGKFTLGVLSVLVLQVGYIVTEVLEHDKVAEVWPGVKTDGFHYIDGHRYYMNNQLQVDWQSLHGVCAALNMTLVGLETEEENDAVTNYIRDNVIAGWFWTSGLLASPPNAWEWSHSGEAFEFTNWREGFPVLEQRQCDAVSLSEGVWWNEPCTYTNSLFCEDPR